LNEGFLTQRNTAQRNYKEKEGSKTQANYAPALECCCQGYLFSQTLLILYAHTQLCLLIPQ